MTIPIQNLYYLLIYAWDALDEADVIEVDAADHTSLLDLFARVLNNGVEHLIRRGLDRDYVSISEDLAGVRGRIRVEESVKRLTFPNARVCCEFDDFSFDVTQNQIIKSTLRALSRSELVERSNRHELYATYRRMPEVSNVLVTDGHFRKVRLHRNNRFYRFLLEICRTIHNNLLVNEQSGESRFRDFVRDPREMARLFEKFVRNFYRREQTRYTVSAEMFRWQSTQGSAEDLELLPSMLTDISLRDDSTYLVFDTKYYKHAMAEHRGTRRLHSAHIYQLFAYMQNLAVRHGSTTRVEGALLYPAVNYKLDVCYKLHGHTLRVVTVNLDQDWQAIRSRLLSLVGFFDEPDPKAAINE